MKNIQIIDGALNCAYDIFAATDDEFLLIFPLAGQDIQFVEDMSEDVKVETALTKIWKRRLNKKEVSGIHGTLFYELTYKKQFYPNRQEEDLTKALGRVPLSDNL